MSMLAMLVAAVAVQSAQPSLISNPDWLERPNGAALAEAYPQIAQQLKIEGRATIQCAVDAGGALDSCEVISETPKGLGFGAAALRLSAGFHMSPKTRDGVPVDGGCVRIPIRFALPAPQSSQPIWSKMGDLLPPLDPPPASPEALELARKLVEADFMTEAAGGAEKRQVDMVLSSSGVPLETRRRAAKAILDAGQAAKPKRSEAQAALLAAYMPLDAMQATLEFQKSPASSILKAHSAELSQAFMAATRTAMQATGTVVGQCVTQKTIAAACIRAKAASWSPPSDATPPKADKAQLDKAARLVAALEPTIRNVVDQVVALFPNRDATMLDLASATEDLGLKLMRPSLTRIIAEQLPVDTLDALIQYAEGPGGKFTASPNFLRLAMAQVRMEQQFSEITQADARKRFCGADNCQPEPPPRQ